MQGTSSSAGPTLLIEALCGFDCVGVYREDRPELRSSLIVRLDAVERQMDEAFVAQCAYVDRLLNVGDARGTGPSRGRIAASSAAGLRCM